MIGTQIIVQSYKLDGSLAREWPTVVEQSSDELLVGFAPRGTRCGGPRGGWEFRADTRTYYWYRRGFNLIEIYDAGGALEEIYIHIASRPELKDGVLRFTDYELDVVQRTGDIPRLVDVDEFHEVVEKLSLPAAFQAECYRLVSEALSVIETWRRQGTR